MTSARQRRAAMHARNAGLQRLRSLTKRVGIAMTVLTGLFAALAAAANSGHHHKRSAATTTATSASTTVPAPSALPPVRGDNGESSPAPLPTPARPQQAPAQTQQPPVATSGGS